MSLRENNQDSHLRREPGVVDDRLERERAVVRQDKRSPGSSNNAQWITICVCAIAFMLLFREPITNVVNHTAKVQVNQHGVTLETRTKVLDTPIGQAQVSAVSVQSQTVANVEGIQGSHYTSRQNGFEISWPEGRWSSVEEPGPDTPLEIRRTEPIGLIAPVVQVKVSPAPASSIRSLTDDAVQQLQDAGCTVIQSSVDENTNSSFLTVSRPSVGGITMYVFERSVIANGRLYNVVAGGIPTDEQLSQQLQDEIRGILNSFHIIVQ